MAKSIKAIQCPKCGSIDKLDLGDDKYVCQSCETEYFLDDDYTHVVHHHKSYDSPAPQPTIEVGKYRNALVIAGVGFMILLGALASMPSGQGGNTYTATRAASNERSQELLLTKTKDDQLRYVNLTLERKGSYPDFRHKLISYFYDENAKMLKKEDVDIDIGSSTFPSSTQHYMSNGDAYIILDEKKLLKVLTDLNEIVEMRDTFFNKYAELASGVAKIEKKYDQDAFKVTSQEGKTYILLPLINKIIPATQEYKADEVIPPGATVHTLYKFCGRDLGILIKYKQKIKQGYLIDEAHFDCEEEDLNSSAPEARFTYTGLVSYAKLTDRIFFRPEVLNYNDKMVIVKTRTDANDSSPFKVQALSPQNGEILWTCEFEPKGSLNPTPSLALSNAKNTLIATNLGGYTVDNKTGKTINKLNTSP